MTTADTVNLMEAVTKLLGVLVWPAILAFFLVRFRTEVGELIASLSELTLKGGSFEASLKRKQAEAAASLGAATAMAPRPNVAAVPEAVAHETRAAAELVADVVTPRVIRRAERSTALWVDDRPANNIHERQALEAVGINFVLATSTDEAKEKLDQQPFDAIISDMDRPPDPQAGYTLLDWLRRAGKRTPFIIYASSDVPEHRAEARRRGAFGSTNRPDELFEMVLTALSRRA